MQQYPLLRTKLHIPLIRPDPSSGLGPSLVLRPRLIERLNAGLLAQSGFPPALTLISAPAGFGKTTLLAEWVTSFPDRAAWLTLDKGDNDQTRFWMYLIAALQTRHPGLGHDAWQLLQAPQQPPTQTIVTTVLNEVTALSQRTILVLDDYHLISDRAVHEGMAFLVENLPPQMHVMISTRADPPLPIHRLRARGQLTELRSTDLRFTADEAAEFLNTAMGLNLMKEDVEALEARTEGWIVGLQLAALSLRGRADAHEFITAFSGGHHYVLEYLTEEVLRRQPDPVQRFLMQTSLLDRLCGPLCDAVTAERDGDAMLAYLRQRNLFILPLDDEHRWVRYHHLFADLLGNLLRREWPAEHIRQLHLRASAWYEEQGWTAEAMDHAVAAGDYERTAQLIERNSLAMVTNGQLTTLMRAIRALPQEVAVGRPGLCVHQAWPLILTDRGDAAEPFLQQIERQVPVQDRTDEDKETLSHAGAMRAMTAMIRGDMPRAIELARRAGELLPADNVIPRNTIAYTLASAYLAEGDLPKAEEALAEVLNLGRAADNAWMVIRAVCDLAELEIIQGRLRTAADLCHEAMQEAGERGVRQLGTVGYALVKLGEILYERDELIPALDRTREGVALMHGWRQPYEMVTGYTTMALILQAQNDAPGAREELQHAEVIRSQHPHYHKLNSIVDGCRVRLRLAQDGPEGAAHLARQIRLGQGGAVIYREREQIILARILLASQQPSQALRLLDSLVREAETGGRRGRLVEMLILQALAWQAQGEAARALIVLEKALVLGEADGYVRAFVDGGTLTAALLHQAAVRGIAPQYAHRLLAAVGAQDAETAAAPAPPSTAALIEPLTARELEVLQLLGEGYSNREIARTLVITLNGVKKHNSNIYGKLGVHSRTQAVVRAQDLGLL